MKLLQDILPRYAAHVEKYPNTLLIKFFGLHRVKPVTGSKAGPALISVSGACSLIGTVSLHDRKSASGVCMVGVMQLLPGKV